MEPDAAIIQRCLQGDAQEYRLLVERHAAAVRAFIRPRVGSSAEVEDIAAETFSRGFMKLKRLRNGNAFGAWLLGIAERIMLERQRRPRLVPLDDAAYADRPVFKRDVDPPLLEAIESLSEPLRQVVILRFFKGLTCAQLAQHLNQPIGTITKQLSRAYALLREALRENQTHSQQRGSTNEVRRIPGRDCRVV